MSARRGWAAAVSPATAAGWMFLAGFLAATPVAAVAVFAFGGDRRWWGECAAATPPLAPPLTRRPATAMANSVGFSVCYCCLYAWPLLRPGGGVWARRLEEAQAMWIVWLST